MEKAGDIYELLYRKLKQAIYYEPDLVMQRAISEFEVNEEIYRKDLLNIIKYIHHEDTSLEVGSQDDSIIDKWLNQIKYHIIPKKIDLGTDREYLKRSSNHLVCKRSEFLSNITTDKKYYWEDVNYIFDIPIPLLFLDVWWCIEVGVLLDKELGDCCYANRLHKMVFFDKEQSSHLFKKYIDQYNGWRVKAINSAKTALENNEFVTILSLDFSKYYYSVSFDFSDIHDTPPNSSSSKLTAILRKIHAFCTDNIRKEMGLTHTAIRFKSDDDATGQDTILPIGLFSSKIISNWYLNKFDKKILAELSPKYYGRYVDDVLLVLSHPKHTLQETIPKFTPDDIPKIIEKYLIQNHILAKSDLQISQSESDNKNDPQYYVSIDGIPKDRIIIKNKKIKVFQFDPVHSHAAIKLLENNIGKNSRVFNYLPEEPLEDKYSDDLYQLIFEDKGINKIRNVDRIALNPTELSVLIAKQAHHLEICGKPSIMGDEFVQSILNDLKGMNYLEYLRSWEKIFTLFVLSNDVKKFIKTYKEISESISRLTPTMKSNGGESNNNEVEKCKEGVKSDLQCYLKLSAALALSLLSADNRKEYVPWENADAAPNGSTTILGSAKLFRGADMFRHHHVIYPLLNYIKGYDGDLCGIDVFQSDFPEELTLDDKRIWKSPCFIHSHEYQLFYALKSLKSTGCLAFAVNNMKRDKTAIELAGYLKEALKKHSSRYQWISSVSDLEKRVDNPIVVDLVSEYTMCRESGDPSLCPVKISITGTDKNLDSVRVGLANIDLNEKNLEHNYGQFDKPNISIYRWFEISEILNAAVHEHCNIVVLPELAIPSRWLVPLTLWSKEHQIGLVFGLEHVLMRSSNISEVKNKDVAYNITSAILPFQLENLYKSCCVSLRIKNHYAPVERSDLLKNNYQIPDKTQDIYNLYNWRGNQFTIFNCFELADAKHRSLFRSDIDFLIACSWNKDTTYFTDIVESASRDLHCYVIHSNPAKYGCSRITQPTEQNKRDLLMVGGGKNSTLLVADLDVKALTEFQVKNPDVYDKEDNHRFKPLPPGFDSQKVRQRHTLSSKGAPTDLQKKLNDF